MGFSEHYGIKHANMHQWINSLRGYSSNCNVSMIQILKKKTPPINLQRTAHNDKSSVFDELDNDFAGRLVAASGTISGSC